MSASNPLRATYLAGKSTTGTRFKYTALKDPDRMIRLLAIPTIKLSRHEGYVDWTLETISNVEHPKYIALSYVWGTGGFTTPIFINGKVSYVTETLAVALKYLLSAIRNSDPGMPSLLRTVDYIWVDAICIDQKNADEKTHQVQRMFNIYQEATAVIGWLGISKGGENKALKVLGEMGCILPRFRGQYTTLPQHHSEATKKVVFDQIRQAVTFGALATGSILSLFQNQFWRRIWILQETIAPETLFYLLEEQLVDWFDLFMGVDLVRCNKFQRNSKEDEPWMNLQMASTPCYRMLNQRSKQYIGIPRDSLLTFLEKNRGELYASDQRDYIYALLNVASDSTEFGLVPDYSKSYEQLYIDIAAMLISKKLSIEKILSNAQGLTDPPSRLPTWVPDWGIRKTVPINGYNFNVLGKERFIFEKGCRFSNSRTTVHMFRNSLQVKGVRIDEVTDIGQEFCQNDKKSSFHAAKDWLLDFHKLLSPFIPYPGSALSETDARDHVVCYTAIGCPDFTQGTRHEDIYYKEYKILRGITNPPESIIDDEAWRIENSREYVSQMSRIAAGRKYFVTADGHVCLGPKAVKFGDLLCVILADVPFVLRPIIQGYYQLLGEVYVFGGMHGSLIQGSPRKRIGGLTSKETGYIENIFEEFAII